MGRVISISKKEEPRDGLRQSDVAFHAIHTAIVRCEIVPGSIATEVDLAERFDVGCAAA